VNVKYFLFLILINVIFYTGNSYAEESNSITPIYSVYTNAIPGLLNEDMTGAFVELNNEISKRAKINLVLNIIPPKRLRSSFHKKEVDIVFPMLTSSFDKGFIYYRSSAFYVKKDFVYTLKRKTLVSTMKQLEMAKGTIGLTRGYSYPEKLLSNSKLSFDYSPGDNQNMLKLTKNRITSLIVEEVSGIHAAKKTKVQGLVQYDPKTPLFTQDVFYAFQAKPSLIKVKNAISKAINEMKADGTLKKILRKLQP